MLVDTKGLRQEHVGKRLRIDLTSGEVDEIKLLDVTACDPRNRAAGSCTPCFQQAATMAAKRRAAPTGPHSPRSIIFESLETEEHATV